MSRSSVLFVLIAATLLALPLAAQDPVAAIESIVVGGQKRDEATSAEAFVIRPRAGQTEPARKGLDLYSDDELRTGNAAQVVLIFFDNPNQKSNQVTVDAGSRVRLVRPNAILLRLGRLLASVRGVFDVATELVVLAARGTMFEAVAAPGGGANLMVLEGAVDGSVAALGSAPVEGEMNFAAPPGRVVNANADVSITNRCDQRVRFEIRPPSGMAWISFAPVRVDVDRQASRTVRLPLRLDATNLPGGTYRGEMLALCQNCGRVRGCTQDRYSFPVAVSVAPPAVRTVGRQQALFGPGAGAVPAAAEVGRFRGALAMNSQVAVASRPTYPPESLSPYFRNLAERRNVLDEAAFRAFATDDAQSWEDYGDLYLDWSDPPKALDAYRKAAALDRSRLQSAPYLIKLGEALRGIGELDEAQRVLSATLQRAPDAPRAHNAIATVMLDRARIARDQGDAAGARRFLEAAIVAARRSIQADTSSASAWGNLGEAHWLLGELDRQVQPGRASPAYDNAVSAFNTAMSRSAQYAFAQVGWARAHHSLGLSAQARGERTTAASMFSQARGGYNRAAGDFQDLAPAYVGLGNLVRDTDPANTAGAIEFYRRAIAARPRHPEAYFQIGDLLERIDPQQAARYFRIFRRVEKPPFLQGERGRRAGGDTRPLVAVPALRGLKERPARELIARSNLAVGRVESRPSTASKGTVIDQRPADASRAPAGSTVDIVLAGEGRLAVPNVVGRTRDEVIALLAADFRADFKEDRDSAPPGIVFRQKPAAGEMEKPGKKIDVYVSRGGRPAPVPQPDPRTYPTPQPDPRTFPTPPPDPRTYPTPQPDPRNYPTPQPDPRVDPRNYPPPPARMPDFRRMTAPSAGERAASLGLRVRVESRPGKPEGIVIDQRPAPGDPYRRGDALLLIVAEQSLRMPDFRRMKAPSASDRAASLGLRVQIEPRPGKTVGIVLDQRPAPGDPYRRGDTLVLVVAAQPPQPPPLSMPNLTGVTIDHAARLATGLGLKVSVVSVTGKRNGVVVNQDPKPGAPYRRGDTVRLYVERLPPARTNQGTIRR